MFLVAVLYATLAVMTFINSKLMLSNPYPIFVGMLRALGSSILLLGFIAIKDVKVLKNFSLPREGWRDLLIYAVTIHAGAMCGFSIAMQYADPVKACFILAMSPFITALLQYCMHKELLTKNKVIGLVIGFIGMVIMLLSSDHGEAGDVPEHMVRFGEFVFFISTILFSYGWVVMKRFTKSFTYPTELVNGIAMLVGGLITLVLSFIKHGSSLFSLSLTESFVPLMAWFLASSLLSYSLYAYLLKRFTPTFLSFAGFLEPVFGLLIGVLFFNHPITLIILLSLVILFTGLYIFFLEEKKEHLL